jgi:hypothetical protein
MVFVFIFRKDRPDKLDSARSAKKLPPDATSAQDAKLSKSLSFGQQGKTATDLRRLKSTPVHSPEPNNDSDADEPDTPGLDYVMGEGGEERERGGEGEGGTHPKQFNQVMLQAQNRMVLIAVLSDQKEKICEEVLTKLNKSRPPKVDKGQLLVVISALTHFARSDSDAGLEDILGQLKWDCFHDHHLKDDVELSCKTLIPTAVTMANKRHGTAPHAMFAIDEIVLCGVRSILVIVSPESVQSISEKIPLTPTKSPSQISLTVTTPVTTPTSSVDARDIQRQLRTALEENLQLLKDMNDVMRTYVLEVKGQMPRPAARKKVTFQTDSAEGVDSGVATGDSNLVAWLEDIQLDHASIQRFVAEQLTLSDVRDHMTRGDIVDLKLKIGPRCRAWAAISEYRSSKLNTT